MPVTLAGLVVEDGVRPDCAETGVIVREANSNPTTHRVHWDLESIKNILVSSDHQCYLPQSDNSNRYYTPTTTWFVTP
jgi:hypothetical protein